MIDYIEKLLALEATTLVTIAVGYLGYRIAYAERADPQNTTQTVFLSVCFTALFQTVFLIGLTLGLPALLGKILGAIITLIAAAMWRRKGIELYGKLWLKTGGTHIDGLNSVLDTIRTGSEFKPTSLLVSVDEGPFLYCDDLARFKDYPFGPCLIGADGSLALYVTHTRSRDGNEWVATEEHASDQITIIPAAKVQLIETRIEK